MNAIMKILEKIKVAAVCVVAMLWLAACENGDVVDFGFDGSFSGTLKDESGNVVAGNITSNSLVIRALGEGDQVSTDMRVNGDGTYQNTKLYPKPYKIWVAGPVTMATDTLFADFSKEKRVIEDLVVIPYLRISLPGVVGAPTESGVDISFDITGNDGNVTSKRELYCSTNPYPDASTGSGPFYNTIKVSLPADNGTVNVTGLAPKTKYFIRVGAQAVGASGFNYSEQIVITTP